MTHGSSDGVFFQPQGKCINEKVVNPREQNKGREEGVGKSCWLHNVSESWINPCLMFSYMVMNFFNEFILSFLPLAM
jgi:hypothetical protein